MRARYHGKLASDMKTGNTVLTLIHRASRRPDHTKVLGPYQLEELIERPEEGAATVYRVVVAPNSTTAESYHAIAEELYYVLSGCGKARLNGVVHELVMGDFLRLPPGVVHSFSAADVALEMLNIHTPGCRPDRDTYFAGETPEGFGTSAPKD